MTYFLLHFCMFHVRPTENAVSYFPCHTVGMQDSQRGHLSLPKHQQTSSLAIVLLTPQMEYKTSPLCPQLHRPTDVHLASL